MKFKIAWSIKNPKCADMVIGCKGEVGAALLKLYKEASCRGVIGIDLKHEERWKAKGKHRVDIMNVCIPYSRSFINIVKSYVDKYAPSIIVIHSTVPVGTTLAVQRVTYVPSAHSPIRGTHPALYRGLTQFVKFIGPACGTNNAWRVDEHFRKLGLRTYMAKDSTTTEAAKLQETSGYGVWLHWTYETYMQAKALGANYDDIEQFVRTTNDYVPRPVLYPPKDGKIGGHCVVPNAKLLQKQLKKKSPYLAEIIKME